MKVAARVAATLALALPSVPARAQDLPCRLDGRLLPAARAALLAPPPPAATVRTLTEDASLRAPEVLTWRADGGDASARLEGLRRWIETRAPRTVSRCAVVADPQRTAAALVPRLAEVIDEPASGLARRWRVALPAGATTPQLVVAPDDGPISRRDIDAAGGVSATLAGGATLQVVLSMDGDPQVWARWREGPADPRSAPQVEDAMGVHRAVEGVRRRAGCAGLRPDPLAAMLAARRARVQAETRRLAHVVEGQGPVEALAQSSVRAGVLAEVMGRGPTLSDALGAVLGSPSHREQLEAAELRAIGVGTAAAEGQVYLVILMTDGTALTEGAR